MSESPYIVNLAGQHTHVLRLGSGHFPAWEMPDGSYAIDLRHLDAETGKPTFSPDKLHAAGVNPDLIKAASTSKPTSGIVLIRNRARGDS